MAVPKFPSFGFPSERLPQPPSAAAAGVIRLGGVASIVLGALIASVVINVVLAGRIVASADALPFVADGGVAGCQASPFRVRLGGAQ
ncbi:hypothetical protein V5F40_21780 [Xanthobacter sp. DSM 14520]|uniref:hypothetical protein n=1 Tax=Xanthobacter autotrophicus (strain ATCC BAA-1158 / Py2) TaxID=78245 RepID=UPI0037276B75